MYKIASHGTQRDSGISRAEASIRMGWHQEDRKRKFLSSAAAFVKTSGHAGQKRASCEVLAQALKFLLCSSLKHNISYLHDLNF